jgi:hypothetical protein
MTYASSRPEAFCAKLSVSWWWRIASTCQEICCALYLAVILEGFAFLLE